MSEKRVTNYIVLHLRFRLRVPPDVFLAHSQEAATIIASVEGLIWKIWILKQEESEIGGLYLFADRAAAESYLKHPIVQAVRGNPAVITTQSELWEIESSLSAVTRGPLPGFSGASSEPEALLAGGH